MSIAEKLTTIAENEQKVYEAGKKAEYDAFWDTYQDCGNRESYVTAFAGWGWSNRNFYPKYDMKPTTAERMFSNFSFGNGNSTFDLQARCEKCGVSIDFSRCTNFYYAFAWANVSRIGVIDASSGTNFGAMFTGSAHLVTIDELIVSSTANFDSYVFSGCTALANIKITGTLANDTYFSNCPLTKASMTSVVNALSPSAVGKKLVLNKSAKEAAFTSSEWDALISTKSNWTISLV